MGLSAWGIQSGPFAACWAHFVLKILHLFTLMPQSPFPLFPRKMRKWNSPNLSEAHGFECLGHSNWTICSLLSPFCSEHFPTFHFYAPEPISFIPQENEKMEFSQHKWGTWVWVPGPLGHSNWTICSLLSPFCSENFPTFHFYAPEPISFIPQENKKMEFS